MMLVIKERNIYICINIYNERKREGGRGIMMI